MNAPMVIQTQPHRVERQMARPLLRSLPALLRIPPGLPWRTVREPMVESVVPDILVATGPGARKRPFRRGGRPTYIEASILGVIEEASPISAEDIRKRLFMSSDSLERHLDGMKRRGWIVDAENGWFITDMFRSTEVSLVAVELKLNLWRQALQQAVRYRRFAEQAVVVMDGNRTKTSDQMLARFEQAGVGLWLQYGSMTMEILRPTTGKAVSSSRFYATTFFTA